MSTFDLSRSAPRFLTHAPRSRSVSASLEEVVAEAVNRTLAAVLLLVLLPVLLLVAFSVTLSSPGGPLFRQRRVGLDGREFTLLKFRTMRAGAERELSRLRSLNEHAAILFKIRDDPRVTRVGRWLRRFSADELPQLWNVVRGEMRLVGPRPALPTEVAEYDPLARGRLRVKPGLTGLWQVSGRSNLSWEESIRLDLHYVANCSAVLDARILLRTVGAVVRSTGAY